MVVSRTDREAVVLGEMFENIHDSLPEWLQAVFEKNNKHEKRSVETGCKIFFCTPEATIGHHIDILFIDEAAFINKMNEHWRALYPTIANKGRAIVISTVNSDSGWFHGIYQSAKQDQCAFKVFRAEYTEHPDWKEDKIETLKNNLGKIGFQQEMEQKFLPKASAPDESSLDPVFERFKMLKGAGIKDINKPAQLLYECELKGGCRENEPEGVRKKMEAIDKVDLREKKGYSFKCANMNQLAKMFPEITPEKISRVSHPHMNEEFDMSSKNLAEIFEGLAEYDDKFKEAAKYWRSNYDRHERRQEELEAKVHGVFPADLLRLAGVISKKEEKEIEETSSTGKVDILQAIVTDSSFPKSLNLSFGDYLEVNGVPTLITTNSVKNTYMGLAALWDHGRAVKFVSEILKEKLDTLFGF